MSRKNELLMREMLAYASVVFVGALDKDMNVVTTAVALAAVNLAWEGITRWWSARKECRCSDS